MGKISVDAFLRQYNVAAKQKGSAMENFIKQHIVTDYINYLNKVVICEGIINATCRKQDGDRSFIVFNSPSRYMFFVMKLIENYTDIELKIDDDHSIDYYYDELNKIGAIDALIAAIPPSEYAEFQTLLNMRLDDLTTNEYSVTALLYNLKQEFSISEELINSVIEELKKQVE